jgi:5-methylcytosine-specific restriction protein A
MSPWLQASHSELQAPARRRKADQQRRNATDRGYDHRWRKFRRWFISRHPTCEDCKQQPTVDVHETAGRGEYGEHNCIGLCHVCHSKRTAAGERGGR